jgi:hypothetical protein
MAQESLSHDKSLRIMFFSVCGRLPHKVTATGAAKEEDGALPYRDESFDFKHFGADQSRRA